tara:strand:- start:49 stop:153 length:105 start_codon:yes stop_codon:yes gene_type:complete
MLNIEIKYKDIKSFLANVNKRKFSIFYKELTIAV